MSVMLSSTQDTVYSRLDKSTATPKISILSLVSETHTEDEVSTQAGS